MTQPAEAMAPERVHAGGGEFDVYHLDKTGASSDLRLFWAHGWGQSHHAFLPLAQSLAPTAPSSLVDFPGFGSSPPPPGAWGTEDYADAVAAWLATLPRGKRVWIGHSFGCRVGLRLAARHAGAIDGLFLIAAAGLPRRRSLLQTLRLRARGATFRTLRRLLPEGPAKERLRAHFGSADYRQAGVLRPTLVKTVSEDQSDIVPRIRCPVALIYGEQDGETPPEIGQRLQALNPSFQLSVLTGYDHYTILTEGRHQIVHRLVRFLQSVTQ